jgi:hypothetical protein
MKTHLEIIREACIKANPSILELKFGCEIKINDALGKIIIVKNIFGVTTYKVIGSNIDYLEDEFTEILGRPIRLSDIIFTLYKNKKAQYFGGMLDDNSIYFANRIGWNLLHDDIELQSQPTKDFIAGLLKETK